MSMAINILKIIKASILPRISTVTNKMFSDKYLLITNVGISLNLSCLGDVLEQHYEMHTDRINGWDQRRTINMALSGTSVGIVCHYWYRYLDRILPGYTVRIVMKKIVVDQIIGSPLCISAFFLTIGALEGASKEQFIEEVKQKAWRLYAAEWMIWPPAQFVNFYLLSTKYRVLFDNLVSLGFDVYFSYVKHNIPLESKKENIQGDL